MNLNELDQRLAERNLGGHWERRLYINLFSKEHTKVHEGLEK